MTDENPTLTERAEKAAKNSFFTIVGHGAATLSLAAMIWLAGTVTDMDKQLTGLRAELTAGIVPGIAANRSDIEDIEDELELRTQDRFTGSEAAAMEYRIQQDIQELRGELRRFMQRQEGQL